MECEQKSTKIYSDMKSNNLKDISKAWHDIFKEHMDSCKKKKCHICFKPFPKKSKK